MDPDSTAVLGHVQEHWESLKCSSPIYNMLLDDVAIVKAHSGQITARLKVTSIHLNSKGTLHGTVSACLTDWAGGLAIASTGMTKTGVSTDIHTTYLTTAKEDDLLEVIGRANKVGGTLAFTTVEIQKVADNGTRMLVATGTHTKFVGSR